MKNLSRTIVSILVILVFIFSMTTFAYAKGESPVASPSSAANSEPSPSIEEPTTSPSDSPSTSPSSSPSASQSASPSEEPSVSPSESPSPSVNASASPSVSPIPSSSTSPSPSDSPSPSAATSSERLTITGLDRTMLTSHASDFSYQIINGTEAEITGYKGADKVVTIPDTIDGHTVTSIGLTALYGNAERSLTQVVIGNKVNNIDFHSFSSCTSLTQITVSSGNAKYSSQGGVLFNKQKTTIVLVPVGLKGTYTIPAGVTSIGDCAFEECLWLTGVIIPDSVTNIGPLAFWDCAGLTGITIPAHVTSIGDSAFEGCSGLTSVTIPDSVTSIGSEAFNCEYLTQIKVGSGNAIYSSQGGALLNKQKTMLVELCGGIKGTYTVPGNVTSIGDSAFEGCFGLTGVIIPGSVTNIGQNAFNNCERLTGITIPDSVTGIGDGAFCNCFGLTSVHLGKGISELEDNIFVGCRLTSITIPDNVHKIGFEAFGECNALTSVSIPDTVTDIDSFAFFDSGLTGVVIPASVTTIGTGAFADCSNLTTAVFKGNAISNIGHGGYSPSIPDGPTGVFYGDASNFKILYNNTATGWTTPTWNGYPCYPLAAPTVTAQNASVSSIVLNWNKVAGAIGYYLYRSASSDGTYSKIATITSGATVSYTNTGLAAGVTYYYKMKAYFSTTACNSALSDYTSAKAVPKTPAVTAASAGYNSVKVSWNAVSGASGYYVEKLDPGTGTYTRLAQIKSGTTVSYTNTGLTAGAIYSYKVAAYTNVSSTVVIGAESAAASAIPVPATPANVKAQSSGYNSISVSWNAVPGATGYIVSRLDSSTGTYTQIKDTTGISYTDTGLTTGTTYYYKVHAYIAGVQGRDCTAVTAKPVPAAPTGLVAASQQYNTAKLTWNTVEGAGGYTVYRSTSKTSGFKPAGSAVSPEYIDMGLMAGTKYYYKVVAVSNGANSAYSAVVSAKPVPATPANAVAVSTGYSSIKVKWDTVSGASGYYIYRSTSSSGTYAKIATITKGSTVSYTDKGLTTNKKYYYKVQGYRTAGSVTTVGATSGYVSARPVPAAPAGVTAVSGVQVNWRAVPGASGYYVYRSDTKDGEYALIKIITSGTVVTYTDTAITAGLTYYYKVAAYTNVSSKPVPGGESTDVSN